MSGVVIIEHRDADRSSRLPKAAKARQHGPSCRCFECRHERFNPGPPTNPRRVNFYGHFRRSRRRARYLRALVNAQPEQRLKALFSAPRSWISFFRRLLS